MVDIPTTPKCRNADLRTIRCRCERNCLWNIFWWLHLQQVQQEQQVLQEEQEEVVVVDSRCSRQERVLRLVEMLSNAASESKWDRCQAEISSAQLQSQSQQFRSLGKKELKIGKKWDKWEKVGSMPSRNTITVSAI